MRQRSLHSRVLGTLLLCWIIVLPLVGTMPPQARAAETVTYTVNSELDGADTTPDGMCLADQLEGGPCTLRAALFEANFAAYMGDRAVVNVPEGTYTLSLTTPVSQDAFWGDLDLVGESSSSAYHHQIVIQGTGPGSVEIDADGIDRVLEVQGAVDLELYNLVIKNGLVLATAAEDAQGGGILFNGSQLLMRNVSFQLNEARGKLVDPTFSSQGGALSVENAILDTIDCSFVGNKADVGSAIYTWAPGSDRYAFLYGARILDNEAADRGAVVSTHSPLYLVNATVTDNVTRADPGGAQVCNNAVEAWDTAAVQNSTLQSAGWGWNLTCRNRPCAVRNSVFLTDQVGGAYGKNCAAVSTQINTGGGNVADDTSCWSTPAEADLVINRRDWQLAQRFGRYWVPYGSSPVVNRRNSQCIAITEFIGTTPQWGGLLLDARRNGRDDNLCDAGAIEGLLSFTYLPWAVVPSLE
ncbi:MAG: hypothetical protein ACOX2L_03725 [Anaerolineae bacterium]|jgi:hypothetical protein|nr:hypothetical protein [Chloroflexota bacterium]